MIPYALFLCVFPLEVKVVAFRISLSTMYGNMRHVSVQGSVKAIEGKNREIKYIVILCLGLGGNSEMFQSLVHLGDI